MGILVGRGNLKWCFIQLILLIIYCLVFFFGILIGINIQKRTLPKARESRPTAAPRAYK